MSTVYSINSKTTKADVIVDGVLIAKNVTCEYYTSKSGGYGSVEIDRHYSAEVNGVWYEGWEYHNADKITWRVMK